MTQKKINKVIEYLKPRKLNNDKVKIMLEHLEREKVTFEEKKNGRIVLREAIFTLDAKWNYITKNIQQHILNKIIKE